MAAGFAFDRFDKNGSGTLDKNELNLALKTVAQYINVPISQERINELMEQHDEDGSGDLDKDEFLKLVNVWADEDGIDDGDIDQQHLQQHNEPAGVVNPGGDDAGDQGSTSNCGLYSTINSLEDQLRAQGIQLDAKAAVGVLDNQGYEWNGQPVRQVGTTMRALVDNINNSFQNGMVLPCKDGSNVTMSINMDSRQGSSGADTGCVVLAPLADGRGNHFMEVETVDDDGTIHTQNSWNSMMKAEVPSDTFDDALYNYTLTMEDVEQC
jgi:hypothetical protein